MGDMGDKIKSRIFDKIDTPAELLTFKLGSALKMENTVLDMLGKLEQEAKRPALKDQLRLHADQTRGQIENIEQAFASLGAKVDDKPALPADALEMESRTTLKLADERLVDEVILAGAAETEHHEIAVYESLIMLADSLGKQEVVSRLRENLQQEQHTLEQVNMAMQEVTRETAHMTA